MSKIIPVNITTTEQAVTLDATYQFAWLRNMGENDVLLSDHCGIVAGDDDVMTVKAGESGRIATSGRAVYIKTASGTSTGEIHAQNFSDVPFKSKAKGGGQSIFVEPLTVTDNGVYTAPTGKAYSPVTVDVQEEPWQPLQDGYSNFWFELTDDTLSPWLNFSAKNAGATIDWGDGSGEVALDTLTPTHTYSKAGRYVVKVKGVTGIDAQHTAPFTEYIKVLKNVELNNEVITLNNSSFAMCVNLENFICAAVQTVGIYCFSFCGKLEQCVFSNSLSTIFASSLNYCFSLNTFVIPQNINTIPATLFYYDRYLSNITIPSAVTSLGNSCFGYCVSLREIHCQPTTPPTLGTTVFQYLPSNWMCYVPVGYGDTYKSAAGWSTYADHILEEGQTSNRAMLAKFNSAKTDESQDDMR